MARIQMENASYKLDDEEYTGNSLERYNTVFLSGKNYNFDQNIKTELIVDMITGVIKPLNGKILSVPNKLSYALIGFFDGSEVCKLRSWFKLYGKTRVFQILNKYCSKNLINSILEEDLTDQIKIWIQVLDVIFKQTDLLIIKDNKEFPFTILNDYPAIKVFIS